MSDEAADEVFIPLEDYEEPAIPAEEMFRRLLGRVRALFNRSGSGPVVADDQLQKATLDTLNQVVAPPACGPLLDELDATIKAWLAETPRVSHVKVVVLPPCDENPVVETWARQNGHQLVVPPERGALIAASAPDVPALDGEGLLVVPRLEAWLLRHRHGLRAVRALLAALDLLDRPVVIGCNSWAWAFLGKAVDADLLLSDAVTFRAFDAARLHRWFSHLATEEATGAVRFRLPGTGEDVLAQDDEGKPENDYLETLAGRSLGIPWVAWRMWRRSMRSDRGEAVGKDAKAVASADTQADAGEQTLWIAALDEYVLPGPNEQMALLVLQALLIHGPLAPEHLRLVLPLVGESNTVPVLVKAGFLERQGDLLAARPAAYPAIRNGLASAGLPLDRL